MSAGISNIVRLLEKHQYTVRVSIKREEVIVYLPEKYMHASYDSSVIKYRFIQDQSRLIIKYQSLTSKNKTESINIPRYAVILFTCLHINNICNSFYNYDTSLILYSLNDQATDVLSFWGKYLQILSLSSDDVHKETELTLLSAISQQGGDTDDIRLKAHRCGILEGYDALQNIKSGVAHVNQPKKKKSIMKQVEEKRKKEPKKKFSWKSLFRWERKEK